MKNFQATDGLEPKMSMVLCVILYGNPNNPNHEISSPEILEILKGKITEPTFIKSKNKLLGKKLINDEKRGNVKYYSPNYDKLFFDVKKPIRDIIKRVIENEVMRESFLNPYFYPPETKFPHVLGLNMVMGAATNCYLSNKKNEEDESAIDLSKYPPSLARIYKPMLPAFFKEWEKQKKESQIEHEQFEKSLLELGRALIEAAADYLT